MTDETAELAAYIQSESVENPHSFDGDELQQRLDVKLAMDEATQTYEAMVQIGEQLHEAYQEIKRMIS